MPSDEELLKDVSIPWDDLLERLYWYRGTIVKWYDGDSPTIDIDLGFRVQQSKAKLRLALVDTPELKGGTEETKAAGRAARDFCRAKLPEGTSVLVKTYKSASGKYGRWIVEVWYYDAESGMGINVGAKLVQEGHAKVAFDLKGNRV